jgi:hypothetical protein
LYIGLGKLFELVANKLDALSVSAVYKHDIVFNAGAIKMVDSIDKVADNGSLAASGGPVKYNIGDFSDTYEIIEFRTHQVVFGKLGS